MLLTRLKYWRTWRSLSVRELAAQSEIDPSSISLLENLKRSAHGKTAQALASALKIEVNLLYSDSATQDFPSYVSELINKNKTQTNPRKVKTVRNKNKPTEFFWVIEKDYENEDPFKVETKEEAKRLKTRLGQARIYQATGKFEALEQHRVFLIRVIKGHDSW